MPSHVISVTVCLHVEQHIVRN